MANRGVVQRGTLGDKRFSSMARRNQSGRGTKFRGKREGHHGESKSWRRLKSMEAGLQVKEEVLTRGTLPPLRQEERMQTESDKRCGEGGPGNRDICP